MVTHAHSCPVATGELEICTCGRAFVPKVARPEGRAAGGAGDPSGPIDQLAADPFDTPEPGPDGSRAAARKRLGYYVSHSSMEEPPEFATVFWNGLEAA